MIQKEKEVLDYLHLPSIPKKQWDGKSSFKVGVAVLNAPFKQQTYCVVAYDAEKDKKPRVTKVFSSEPYLDIESIFVVPAYMDEDTQKWDVNEESRKAAEEIKEEVKELEKANSKEDADALPTNEWIFPEIHNREEAEAWLRNYNKKLRGKHNRIPTDEETLKMRLLAIYSEINSKQE